MLSEELTKLGSHLHAIAEALSSRRGEDRADERRRPLRRGSPRPSTQWLAQALAGQVYWIETRGERHSRVVLASAPIEVGPALQEQLYAKVPTVVLTSATLSAGGRPASATSSSGSASTEAEDAPARQPVQLPRAGRAAPVPRHARPVGRPGQYEEAVLAKLPEYVERTEGRAFVLFTSYQFLQRAAKQLRPWLREAPVSAAVPGRRAARDAAARAVPRHPAGGAVRRR